GTGAALKAVAIVDALPIEESWLAIVRVISTGSADPAHYVMPLAFLTGDRAAAARRDRPAVVLAELEITGRGSDTTGVCVDACSEPEFGSALLDAIARRRRIRAANGHLGRPTHQRGAGPPRGPATPPP